MLKKIALPTIPFEYKLLMSNRAGTGKRMGRESWRQKRQSTEEHLDRPLPPPPPPPPMFPCPFSFLRCCLFLFPPCSHAHGDKNSRTQQKSPTPYGGLMILVGLFQPCSKAEWTLRAYCSKTQKKRYGKNLVLHSLRRSLCCLNPCLCCSNVSWRKSILRLPSAL